MFETSNLGLAVFLSLTSAVLHAGWNLLMKASEDRLLAAWALFAFSGGAAVPVLVIAGWPSGTSLPYLIVSTAVHVGYVLFLAGAYERTDFSVAYPMARGVAPLLTAVAAVFFLDDRLNALGFTGVVVISATLIWIAVGRGRVTGVEWAAATGVSITVYTLIDAAGVRATDESLRYVAALFLLTSAAMTLVVMAQRGTSRMVSILRTRWRPFAVGGLASLGAYALVLTAARMAPIALVAALRETSVILGALAGWLILKEDLGRQRSVAAVAVAVGVMILVVA